MHVDLLAAVPLDTVRDAPRALPAQKSRELHTKPRIAFTALGQAVVVVGLCEMDERSVLLASRYCTRQIPLECAAVVCLEHLGIRPVEIRLGKQSVRDLQFAAKPLKHEYRVGILLPHSRYDIFPCLERNHVARIAPESVHAVPAPEEEHIGHILPELRI